MTLPRLVLPSQGMPWGRAVQDLATATASRLRSARNDSSSVGRQFAARADALSAQIAHVQNTATMIQIPIANFSASSGFSSTPVTLASPAYFASPPIQGATECRVIVNFQAEKTGGSPSSSLAVAVPVMRVNGKVVGALMQVNRQAPNIFTNMFGSLSATIPILDGSPISVEIGARFGFTPGITMSFYSASAWLAFYGSIQ